METGIATIFKNSLCSVIQLLNKDHVPVGAIYPNSLKADLDNIIISETKTSEKYALYVNGVMIFFSYYILNKN